MQRHATHSELSAGQLSAIDLLVTGRTVSAVSEELGIDRATVHRWRRQPDFQAAFNQRATELRDAAGTRLLQLVERSTETVLRAIEDGNVRAALAVLRGTGFLDGQMPYVGSDDPNEIRRSQTRALEERQSLDALLESLAP